jgi:hypothetical protein
VEGKRQRFGPEEHRTTVAAMNGGGKSIELVSAVDAPLMASAGGGKRCAAERPLLGAHFILRGGARHGIMEL